MSHMAPQTPTPTEVALWAPFIERIFIERIGTPDDMRSESYLRGQATENTRLTTERNVLREALSEIHNWLVCAAIATAEDMAQSSPHMEEVARIALDLPEPDQTQLTSDDGDVPYLEKNQWWVRELENLQRFKHEHLSDDEIRAIQVVRSALEKGPLYHHSSVRIVEPPRVNIKCESKDGTVTGSTYLNVTRVEPEDDGSFTAVTDQEPAPTSQESKPPEHDPRLACPGDIFGLGGFFSPSSGA